MSTFAINNCRLDLEDRELLSRLPELPMSSAIWKAFSRPAEVDTTWHRTENQGQIGSCQGHGLSSGLERLAFVKGVKIQLSEIFAYLATQKIDGLLGNDSGSTISGGVKLALTSGVPPEANTGYPQSYPGKTERARILSQENYAAGEPFKALSSVRASENHEETLDFIGGGGVFSFGISYYQGLIPKDRIVRKFSPSGNSGGHAMVALGYDRDGNIRAANSHADGPYIILPPAWLQMIRHKNSAIIGMMGNKELAPVDWYKNSPYFK